MAIYRLNNETIEPLPETTFSSLGLRERDDLQRLLRSHVEVIAPDVLVIYEEFSDWSESRRRIDLLGVDRDANIVVIELKRTEDGGHMELQAIRYAAMVSTLTFDQAIEIFGRYLAKLGDERDARDTLIEFLDWDDTQEGAFGEDCRVILASADFSKELTTSVLWLRDRSIDIRCVRIRPYENDGSIFLDVQQVVPLPEAEDYQIRVQHKAQKERVASTSNRDFTRFDVRIGDKTHSKLPKRRVVLQVVKSLIEAGATPERLSTFVNWRKLFFEVPGRMDSDQVIRAIIDANGEGNVKRWFVKDDELIHWGDSTYAICNQWGSRTEATIKAILAEFPEQRIEVRASE